MLIDTLNQHPDRHSVNTQSPLDRQPVDNQQSVISLVAHQSKFNRLSSATVDRDVDSVNQVSTEVLIDY